MTDQQAAPLTPPTGTLEAEPPQPDTNPDPGVPADEVTALSPAAPPEMSDADYLRQLHTWTMYATRHAIPLDTSDDQLEEIGRGEAGAVASVQRAIPVSDLVKTIDAPSVKVVSGQQEGWKPIDDIGDPHSPSFVPGVGNLYGEPDGRTVQWKFEVAASPEHIAVEATGRDDQGRLVLDVPELTSRFGGIVRAMHHLGGRVSVDALSREGLPIGYGFASTVDDDEAEVRVVPGTKTLLIRPA